MGDEIHVPQCKCGKYVGWLARWENFEGRSVAMMGKVFTGQGLLEEVHTREWCERYTYKKQVQAFSGDGTWNSPAVGAEAK